MAEGTKVLKWVGLGCGLLVIMGACCGTGAYFLYKQTDEPAAAGRAFFKDLREGNYQDALQRMNGPYQSTHPLATFQQNVSQLPALTQQTDVTFSQRNINNDTAHLEGNLATPSGSVAVRVQLTQIGDYWYIDSVVVGGQQLQ